MSGSFLVEGRTVSSGVWVGRACVVTDPDGEIAVRSGEILVVPHSHPSYAIALMRAAGLICEQGAAVSHLCTVALEAGIPCITQAAGAVTKIGQGQMIVLDADKGVVSAYGSEYPAQGIS